MSAIPVIAIFDIGKTNKKLFLFDEDYRIVFERSARLEEITDEDGFSCEDLDKLDAFILDSLHEIIEQAKFRIKAINFSAYGASLVYIDEKGRPLAPLYNYLKSYPTELSDQLYHKHHSADQFASETASPALGSLNSGLQLYRIKNENPELFSRIKYALHLPQYLSSLLTGKFCSDITSIGCHTALWDFSSNHYHYWLTDEGLTSKFAPVLPCDMVFDVQIGGKNLKTGIGLHDSSAALIPYLFAFDEPFVLISTGTWCISMNPFNHSPLTVEELHHDCLCYLQYNGKPVKASRLFAGHDYDEQVKRIAAHFNYDAAQLAAIPFDENLPSSTQDDWGRTFTESGLSEFKNANEAYGRLMTDLIQQQKQSTQLILKDSTVQKIFVDGGFSKNEWYMRLLAKAFPGMQVYAASVAQASAIGAAMAIHKAWNSKPVPDDVIELNRYPR
jgi:sugar (pentulose or hexulose) kinase